MLSEFTTVYNYLNTPFGVYGCIQGTNGKCFHLNCPFRFSVEGACSLWDSYLTYRIPCSLSDHTVLCIIVTALLLRVPSPEDKTPNPH